MTLGEFIGTIKQNCVIEIELRNAENKEICTCKDMSLVISVYENCELLNWWINGRIVEVHIDDTLVMRKLKKEE